MKVHITVEVDEPVEPVGIYEGEEAAMQHALGKLDGAEWPDNDEVEMWVETEGQ